MLSSYFSVFSLLASNQCTSALNSTCSLCMATLAVLTCFLATSGTSSNSREVTRSSKPILLTPVMSMCLSNNEIVASAWPANLLSSTSALFTSSSCMLAKASTRVSELTKSPSFAIVSSAAAAFPCNCNSFTRAALLHDLSSSTSPPRLPRASPSCLNLAALLRLFLPSTLASFLEP